MQIGWVRFFNSPSMSLDLSREDYWSATTRCTIKERCKFMLNNELLSDVNFQVVDRGAEGGSKRMKKIPAHKFLLAISSPVYYAMLYGGGAKVQVTGHRSQVTGHRSQ